MSETTTERRKNDTQVNENKPKAESIFSIAREMRRGTSRGDRTRPNTSKHKFLTRVE